MVVIFHIQRRPDTVVTTKAGKRDQEFRTRVPVQIAKERLFTELK